MGGQRWRPRFLPLSLLFGLGLACGSREADGDGGTGGTGAVLVTVGGQFGSAVGGGFSATVNGAGSGQCSITPDQSGCTGTAYEPEYTPLDIYVLFDQSGSMCICVDPMRDSGCGGSDCAQIRFRAIEEALGRFMLEPESVGIGMALGFFGFDRPGEITCDPAAYSVPAVPWGTLPGNAAAITAAIDAVAPIGETPTDAALLGACTQAAERRLAHPDHKVVVLLVTDGHPEAPISCDALGGCCPTLGAASAVVDDCREEHGIDTYVLGVGPYLENLSRIAVAGGTDAAYLIQEGQVTERVLEALNAIRADSVIPCELEIPQPPSGESLDYDQVNVVYADANCQGQTFGRVADVAACSEAGGWYYEGEANPERIHLCPTSCEQVSTPGGQMVVQLGCDTVIIR